MLYITHEDIQEHKERVRERQKEIEGKRMNIPNNKQSQDKSLKI